MIEPLDQNHISRILGSTMRRIRRLSFATGIIDMNITDPRPTRLEGFDAYGTHCGSAELRIDGDGTWTINGHGGVQASCQSEQEAWEILMRLGAVTVKEEDLR